MLSLHSAPYRTFWCTPWASNHQQGALQHSHIISVICNSLFSAVTLFAIAADSSTYLSPLLFLFIFLRSSLQICILNPNHHFEMLISSPFFHHSVVPCHSTIQSNPCWLCHVILLKDGFIMAKNNNLPLSLIFLVHYSLPQVFGSNGTCVFHSWGNVAHNCFCSLLFLAFHYHPHNSPSFVICVWCQEAWATYILYLGIFFSRQTQKLSLLWFRHTFIHRCHQWQVLFHHDCIH